MEVWGATAGEKVPRRVKGPCNDWEGLPENSVDWETERERDRKGRKKMKVREKYSLKGKKMRKWQKLACVHECMFGFGVQFRNKLVQSVKKRLCVILHFYSENNSEVFKGILWHLKFEMFLLNLLRADPTNRQAVSTASITHISHFAEVHHKLTRYKHGCYSN